MAFGVDEVKLASLDISGASADMIKLDGKPDVCSLCDRQLAGEAATKPFVAMRNDHAPTISELVEKITTTCTTFMDSIRAELTAWRSKVQFASRGPVDEGDTFAVEYTENPLTVLAVPRDAEKTRTPGSDSHCLYFVGKVEGSTCQGSRDVAAIADHLLRLYPSPKTLIVQTNVECCVAAVATARLFILNFLEGLCPDLEHRDWTTFQLDYAAQVRDVFYDLSSILLTKFVTGKTSIPQLTVAFKTVLRRFKRDAVVIIDNAQKMNEWLPGRIMAADSEVLRSLMGSFLIGLASMDLGTSFYVAGTGESMLGIEKTAKASSSFRNFVFRSQYRLKGI